MDVETVDRSEMKLVGLLVVGRRQELSQRVPLAWLDLVEALGDIDHRVNEGVFYGVFLESDHGGDGNYRYWVMTEVASFGARPDHMVELTIPGGAFATVPIVGSREKIDEAYMALGRSLYRGGNLPAAPWGFERYDVRRQAPTPPYERFDYDLFRPMPSGEKDGGLALSGELR